MSDKIKVAFVLPFAFERFFHDVREHWSNSVWMEDNVISKRNTWHMSWCKAMEKSCMDITIYHISYAGKEVREYKHRDGINIKSVPCSYRTLRSKDEISFKLLTELNQDKPDLIFSVTHNLNAVFDMYDILALFCYLKKIPLIGRNPKASTYFSIFPNANWTHDLRLKNNLFFKKTIFIIKLTNKLLFRYLKFYIKRFCLQRSSLIISQTKEDINNLITVFKLKREQIYMMPKPIDLGIFITIPKANAANFVGLDSNNIYLIHASNLFNTKGCEHIISIFPELIKKYSNIRLLVCGKGPKLAELQNLAKNVDVDNYIYFLGHIEHEKLVYYLNISSALVLPTERRVDEGIPNVLMEAIACNIPVISTNLPGPSAFINEGLGILIEPGNKEELFNSIIKVVENKFFINKRVREQFLKNYSLESVGYQLKILFEKILI